MSKQGIRWEQRFNNFDKALAKLEEAVHYVEENIIEEEKHADPILSNILKQGLIQSFEYTHELAWNVMRDYAAYQGNMEIRGSRDAAREAFSMGLIKEGEVWMEMIMSRNKTSHTYNEETADSIFKRILNDYYPAFKSFSITMESIKSEKS